MTINRSREWQKLPQETQALLEEFQREPKIPLGQMANALGLKVKLSTLAANISGMIEPSAEAESGFIIRVNRHEAKSRQRFTLAHEISHYLLHKDLIQNGIADNVMYRSSLSDAREAEANRLAADLVMPWSILKAQIRDKNIHDDSIIEQIAYRLGVSKIALKIRLGIEG
jgi:Zn-dependent peptidase ImmA (M78 family)